MANKKTELQKIDNQIRDARDKQISDLEEKRTKLRDEIFKEESSKLVGKTFVYRNNTFGRGSKKSDYWDVFIKVIKSNDGGLKILSVDKDAHGNVQIQTENRYSNNLMGYVQCSLSEFNRNFKKLMKEVNDAFVSNDEVAP